MAAEFFRKEYGETPEGYVVVIGFRGGEDEGESTDRYEVRKGVRTISTVPTELAARRIASALVGN